MFNSNANKEKLIHKYCWYQDAATNSFKSQLSSSGIRANSSRDKPMKKLYEFFNQDPYESLSKYPK